MKKTILFVSILALSVGALSAQPVEEIVARHLTAIGGAAKLREVKSIVMENAIKVQGLEIENSTTILIGRAMRSNSKIMGNELVQAFDGATSWAITPVVMGGNGEPQVLTAEMAKSVITQIDPFPLLDYPEKGTKLEVLALEKINNKDAYHLKMSPKDGVESEIWIDVLSGLMSKLKTIQNGQEAEMVFSNYAVIGGITFAMSMEISNPVAGVITINTKAVKLNIAVDELIFKMPITKNK